MTRCLVTIIRGDRRAEQKCDALTRERVKTWSEYQLETSSNEVTGITSLATM